jgi:hypothetical protein
MVDHVADRFPFFMEILQDQMVNFFAKLCLKMNGTIPEA